MKSWIAAGYADAQLDALRVALGAVAMCAVLSLSFTRKLAPVDESRHRVARVDGAPGGVSRLTCVSRLDRRGYRADVSRSTSPHPTRA